MARPDIELKAYAESLGFVAEARGGNWMKNIPYDPYVFKKGNKVIWYVGPGRVSVTLPKEAMHGDWMVADLIDNHFCNHRSYEGLKAALEGEK